MNSSESKEYCRILNCVNNLGTSDKSKIMFRYISYTSDYELVHIVMHHRFAEMRICLYFIHKRVPTKKYASLRMLWIDAIEKLQPIDHNSRAFNVCIDHFHISQIVKLEKKFALAPDAIPSIFTSTLQQQTVSNTPSTIVCNNCVEMTKKNAQLTSDILAGDIQRQSMQTRIDSLKKKLAERNQKLHDTQKELQSKILENGQLRKKITQLEENVCSTMDGSNVISFLN